MGYSMWRLPEQMARWGSFCPLHAMHATFELSIPNITPSLGLSLGLGLGFAAAGWVLGCSSQVELELELELEPELELQLELTLLSNNPTRVRCPLVAGSGADGLCFRACLSRSCQGPLVSKHATVKPVHIPNGRGHRFLWIVSPYPQLKSPTICGLFGMDTG